MQALVDKGLASNIYSYYQTAKFVGGIETGVTPIPDKMKECYAEMMKQISMWGNADYFTDDELAKAKAALKRQQIRSNEKPSSLASQLTFHWCSTSLEYFTDYFPAMDKVTRQDIINYVNKYIVGKPYVAGLIINKEMNEKYKPAEYFIPKNQL